MADERQQRRHRNLLSSFYGNVGEAADDAGAGGPDGSAAGVGGEDGGAHFGASAHAQQSASLMSSSKRPSNNKADIDSPVFDADAYFQVGSLSRAHARRRPRAEGAPRGLLSPSPFFPL